MAADGVISCQFEVFGKVKGVNFRRHVLKKAKTLGLRGWCMNSDKNTVRGYIEGPSPEMDVMKEWLKTTGSPESDIKMVKFSSHRKSQRYGFPNFEIRPDQISQSEQRDGSASSSNDSM
ncbi:hypothetical protein KR054_010279 [Drosophila jambulina]|nr:hypothetical protein KR054_010279 [Drosophila jambulina]